MKRLLVWSVTGPLFFALVLACAQTQAPQPQTIVSEGRPEISEYMASPSVLVFSRTAGWRHNEGIAGADLFFVELAEDFGYGVFTTANPAVFNAEDLERFDLVVFNNVTGAALSEVQQQAFEAWMSSGGAWIGLHGSGDSSLQPWSWYQENLIGTAFIGHTMDPQFQSAQLVSLKTDHPVLEGIPETWAHTDEWYSFSKTPEQEGVVHLVGIDETSYAPLNTVVDRWPEDLSMGSTPSDHPMIWAVCTPAYRGVYSALGHSHQTYRDPVYRRLLANAFKWVTAKGEPTC